MWKWTIDAARSLPKRPWQARGLQSKAQQLTSRAVIRVSGPDAGPFLQGLMTNDIRHVEEENVQSMYCMFLNNQGRILYDALIYRGLSPGDFLVECDDECQSALLKHLTMYRIRKKVSVSPGSDLGVWALFEQPSTLKEGDFIVTRDPRMKELGWRVVGCKNLLNETLSSIHEDEYSRLRYSLGVGEGARDLPPGTSFPLECNCDYLHGVSFHKGCYLGQELTARTYHTGVIRKRLMPLTFASPPEDLSVGNPVHDEKGSKIGKLRALTPGSVYGLGLLRIQQALSAVKLTVESSPVRTHRPSWWPIEAPKDRSQL